MHDMLYIHKYCACAHLFCFVFTSDHSGSKVFLFAFARVFCFVCFLFIAKDSEIV